MSGQIDKRWYCVDKFGGARLCFDKDGAEKVAAFINEHRACAEHVKVVRLIEATPAALAADELLEAVQALLLHPSGQFGECSAYETVSENARAAIAKATGDVA